jgi:transcription-repair coupling factor (superfamily II helicase)
VADKLRFLIPEARFVVAHGQLDSKDLESRVLDFKEGKFDCLVSSTIIENGIDLPNANTLIVNNADQFGLSQLYQLRGRVGRSRKQAYTYLLYAGQRLSLEAKKRLRAIVEASELGSGFQIAMKDLEIRGAGDILGANQHGVIKTVGVSHFVRMLNQTVEEMKSGSYNEEIEVPAEENVNVELPLTSYIPETFIPDYKEKIAVYQKMASMDSLAELKDLRQSIQDEYGSLPEEIRNLFKVLEVKLLAKDAGLLAVRMVNYTLQEKYLELHMSKKITPHQVMNLLKDDLSHKWTISGDKLKIAVRDLGLDWYEGTKAALIKLVEGKQTQEVEKKLKTSTGVPS